MVVRPWAVYNRALELLADDNLPAASRQAQAAVALEPRQHEFRLLLARLLGSLGELDEAVQHALAAAELTPEADEIDALLEYLYQRKHESRQALSGQAGVSGQEEPLPPEEDEQDEDVSDTA